MKSMRIYIVILCLWLFSLSLSAITSTTTGGAWHDTATWEEGIVPTQNDDVVIMGIVTIYTTTVSCHNLAVIGADSMVRNHELVNVTLNIYGDLTATGWLTSNTSNNYHLTVNLYGDLIAFYNVRPSYLNILGSGNRNWTIGAGFPLMPYYELNVAATIDTIFAQSNLAIACSRPGNNLSFKSTSESVTLMLTTSGTRDVYNLSVANSFLENLVIVGGGSSVMTYTNNNCHIKNTTLKNLSLQSPNSIYLESGVVFENVTNSATIYNYSNSDKTLTLSGNFVNNGDLRNHPSGHYLNLDAYGSIINNGWFAPYNLNLLASSGPRELAFPSAYPNRMNGIFYIAPSVNNITAAADLYFTAGIRIDNGNFNLYDALGNPRTMNGNNLELNGSSVAGVPGSSLSGTINATNTTLNNLLFAGTVKIKNGGSATNCQNNGTIMNQDNTNHTYSIYGDFLNNGTVRNNPSGYSLLLNMYGNVTNRGTWSNFRMNLAGSTAQTLSFPPVYSFVGSEMNYTGTVGTLYLASGEDFSLQNCTFDLNSASLQPPTGDWTLFLNNCVLRETSVLSYSTNAINMSNGGYIDQVNFQSIINNGTLTISSTCTVNGSLVNNGTLQNYTNSDKTINITGNIVNNGTIKNNPSGYALYMNSAGNLTNSGTWSNYVVNLSGSGAQTLSFPSTYPYTGAQINNNGTFGTVYLAGDEDFKLVNTTFDLNGASLQPPAGNWTLYLSNCYLRETTMLSNPATAINMSNGGYIDQVSFQSFINNGTLTINSNTNVSGDIVNNGTLQNNTTSDKTINITGNIVNNGTIKNNPSGFSLIINVGGNVTNNNIWSNNTINLNGAGTQEISFPLAHPYTGAFLNKITYTAPIVIKQELLLQNCTASLNNSNLDLLTYPNSHIYLSNTIFKNASVLSSLPSKLEQLYGGYLENVSFQSIEFTGTVTVNSNLNVSGTLLNNAILQNHANTYRHFYVQDLQNSGTIKNNPSGYYALLHINGNLNNSGTISCNYLYLDGPVVHLANTGTISTPTWNGTATPGQVYLDTNLDLTNANISFVSTTASTLYLNYSRSTRNLSLNGGYLQNVNVVGGNGAKITGANNAILRNLTADDLVTEGFLLIDNLTVGILINNGTLKNNTDGIRSMTVQYNLENTGTISNNTWYSLTLNCYGNLNNTGTISNNAVYINGTSNQTIMRNGTWSPTYFYLVSNIGSAAWYKDNLLTSYTGAQVAIPITSGNALGNWQPRVGETLGRFINIALGLPMIPPQNVTISQTGETLLLQWSAVPGALTYKVYGSSQPYNGFSLLQTVPAGVQSTVSTSLTPMEARKFYQVTTNN